MGLIKQKSVCPSCKSYCKCFRNCEILHSKVINAFMTDVGDLSINDCTNYTYTLASILKGFLPTLLLSHLFAVITSTPVYMDMKEQKGKTTVSNIHLYVFACSFTVSSRRQVTIVSRGSTLFLPKASTRWVSAQHRGLGHPFCCSALASLLSPHPSAMLLQDSLHMGQAALCT